MLNRANWMKDYQLESKDGIIGKVREFYFDDRYWGVRYLVAETGSWLSDRRVLISPYALKDVIREKKLISVDLTMKQIEKSPSLNSDKPVSKQFEDDYFLYFGWPEYWGGEFMWGEYAAIERDVKKRKKMNGPGGKKWDAHLRSTNDVDGHTVQAADGELGHVVDFILDDEKWAVRYLVVDIGNWFPGKKVLISPKWIDRISFEESKVFTGFTREDIRLAPEYSDGVMPNRDYEERLHLHYKRRGYWGDEPESDVHSGG
jgi:uncharacterized protein YrrD